MATARPSAEVALASLAILKVNWEKHQTDYIGNFVPFVAECLRDMAQDEVSLEELRELVFAKFGLVIPHGPLKTILARAAREGLARINHGVYRREPAALERASLAAARERVLREQGALLGKLRAFCTERHGLRWSEEEAEEALLAYVSEFAGPILRASLEGTPLPQIKSPGTPSWAYLVNSFVVHLHKSDSEGFDWLESVVKGSMLANVLYYPDLGGVAQQMSGVDVFFDTRIVLQALIGNDYERRARRELFQLVDDLGGRPRIFEETEAEVRGVLELQAREPRDDHAGPPVRANDSAAGRCGRYSE